MVRAASGLVLLWMRLVGFQGWASLWGVAYIQPGFEHSQALQRHERMHLHQMRRDGKARFMARYTWWLLRHGYKRNPYEIEARAAEHDPNWSEPSCGA